MAIAIIISYDVVIDSNLYFQRCDVKYLPYTNLIHYIGRSPIDVEKMIENWVSRALVQYTRDFVQIGTPLPQLALDMEGGGGQ